MEKPKMIIFDYGQTLAAEERFDGVRGTAEVLKYASENRHGLTAEQVQAEADRINRELDRFSPADRHRLQTELPNHMFTAYLYESLGIRIELPPEEIDRVFWDAAAPCAATEGIRELLEYLFAKGIRTGVISNIVFAGSVVSDRINRLLPDNRFEFIITSSEYLFRKPNAGLFKLALEKAGLPPGEVWYAGDNYECDVAGARKAGITPVWYKGYIDIEQEDRDDVIKIGSWRELRELVEGLS